MAVFKGLSEMGYCKVLGIGGIGVSLLGDVDELQDFVSYISMF